MDLQYFRSKKRDSDSSQSSSSTRSSRASSSEREKSSKAKENSTTKTAKETLDDFFKKNSDSNYYLAQKSEMLLFDQIKEPDHGNAESFVWRKKNQKIGLDKLDPQKVLLLNSLKQEETAV